jgi:hypothetical protein
MRMEKPRPLLDRLSRPSKAMTPKFDKQQLEEEEERGIEPPPALLLRLMAKRTSMMSMTRKGQKLMRPFSPGPQLGDKGNRHCRKTCRKRSNSWNSMPSTRKQ